MKRLLFFIIFFSLHSLFYYCRSESIFFDIPMDTDQGDVSIIIDIQEMDSADKDDDSMEDLDANSSDGEDVGCEFKLLSGVVQVSAGATHSCVLMEYGGVKCWGSNYEGKIGDGTDEDRITPVNVSGLSSGVKRISSRDIHSCALLDNGVVKCWGNNEYGQLGDGTTENRLTPVDVIGLGSGVKKISTGGPNTCALLNNGNVKCWGSNEAGQLGNGTTKNSVTPVDVIELDSEVIDISVGYYFACALLIDGRVKCWGANIYGELGDGTTENKSTAVDVYGLPTKVKDISAGAFHTCAVLIDGRVMCWGKNSDWQLGDGNYDEEYRTTPVYVVGLDTEAVQVSAGGFHTCTLLRDSKVMCWGRGLEGQLGDGRVGGGPWPVPAVGVYNAIEVSAGSMHTCALIKGGYVYCWGDNSDGEIGDGTKGTKNNRYTAVSVVICE